MARKPHPTQLARISDTTDMDYVDNGQWNWNLIRMHYVEGFPETKKPGAPRVWIGMKELSERIGAPFQPMRNRAAKENWSLLRDLFLAEYEQTRRSERLRTMANRAIAFDDDMLDLSIIGQKIVGMRFEEIQTEVDLLRTRREMELRKRAEGLPYDRKEIYSAIRHTEVEALAKALGLFQEIGMKALGTDKSKIEIMGTLNGGAPSHQTVNVTFSADDEERMAAFLLATQSIRGSLEEVNTIEANDPLAIEAAPPEDELIEAELIEDQYEYDEDED